MPRSTCKCGGVCGGNEHRCRNNVHFQAVRANAPGQRRASMHVLTDPGDDIEQAVLRSLVRVEAVDEAASEAIQRASEVRHG